MINFKPNHNFKCQHTTAAAFHTFCHQVSTKHDVEVILVSASITTSQSNTMNAIVHFSLKIQELS